MEFTKYGNRFQTSRRAIESSEFKFKEIFRIPVHDEETFHTEGLKTLQ